MLSLGRALGRHPKLVLLDEMSFGLGPVIVEKLLTAARRLISHGDRYRRAHRRTAHPLVFDVSDRAYVLVHGTLALTGQSAELRKNVDEIQARHLGDTFGAEQGP